MFRSEDTYVNRYKDEYYFKKLSETQYEFKMSGSSMKYCGMTAKDDQPIDTTDLGAFDPSGGPYIELGMTIDGKTITRIDGSQEDVILTVGVSDE